MIRIAVIVGSTRPGRKSLAVAEWITAAASQRDDARFELVDIADFALPLLDEPVPPARGQYQNAHTRTWAEAIASFDGFIFVSPEYNHSIPAALKNAIDYLYAEWADKAAGFVTFGVSGGGLRAAEHLRLILAELSVATVRSQVGLSLITDWENWENFNPGAHHERHINSMLDQLVAWSTALTSLRVST